MGPSFAESATTLRHFTMLLGTLCAASIALVALRPEPPMHRAPMSNFNRFDHYKPVKRCVDGRWVIASPGAAGGRSHQPQ